MQEVCQCFGMPFESIHLSIYCKRHEHCQKPSDAIHKGGLSLGHRRVRQFIQVFCLWGALSASTVASTISDKPLTLEPLTAALIAEWALLTGDREIALSLYVQLAQQREEPRLVQRALFVAVQVHHLPAALILSEKWARLSPEDTKAQSIYVILLLATGKSKLAVPSVKRLLSMDADRPLLLSDVLLSKVNEQPAMEKMIALLIPLQNHPQLGQVAQLNRAYMHFQLAQYQQTEQILASLLQRPEPFIDALRLHVTLSLYQGKSHEAVTYLEQRIAKKPERHALQMLYATTLKKTGAHEQAQRVYEKLLTEKNYRARSLYELAKLALLTKQQGKARHYLYHLLDKPDYANEARYLLAQSWEEQGNLSQAIVWYRAVDDGVLFFSAKIQAAYLLQRQQRYAEALQVLQTITSGSDDEQREVYLLEAHLYYQLQHYQRAGAVLDESLKKFPEDVELLYARALLMDSQGHSEATEKALQHILNLEPNNVNALNTLGYLLTLQGRDMQHAEKLLKKAIILAPESPAVLDSMGWLLFHQGQYKAAEQYLRKAYAYKPNKEIAAHLSEVLWVQGNYLGAKYVWVQGNYLGTKQGWALMLLTYAKNKISNCKLILTTILRTGGF